jgi:hypothetical protein
MGRWWNIVGWKKCGPTACGFVQNWGIPNDDHHAKWWSVMSQVQGFSKAVLAELCPPSLHLCGTWVFQVLLVRSQGPWCWPVRISTISPVLWMKGGNQKVTTPKKIQTSSRTQVGMGQDVRHRFWSFLSIAVHFLRYPRHIPMACSW